MEDKAFDVGDFTRVYLTVKVEKDDNARCGGFQKQVRVLDLPLVL